VRQGTNLQVAYFDQTRAALDPEDTAENNVGQGKSNVTIAGRSRHIIGYLGDFLFTPEEARSPIRFFSGGQRNRLLLAKLFASPANLLVLDEPTNDLDSETLELLEERLVAYEGTVLLVSHDRAFLNNVVTSTLVFEGDELREYVGGYDDWVRQRTVQEHVETSPPRSGAARTNTLAAPAKGKGLTYKHQRELDELPALIEQLEMQQGKLHEELAAPGFYKQAGEIIAAKRAELIDVDARLAAAYARWEALDS
jgi:ABC transport system ATP-binding/permease protein